MTNAFTAKPDLSKFLKDAKRTQCVSENGRRANANPTEKQRAIFYNVISPKGKK
jgi:hypothetical protein